MTENNVVIYMDDYRKAQISVHLSPGGGPVPFVAGPLFFSPVGENDPRRFLGQRRQHPLARERHVPQPHPHGVIDGVGDGRRRGSLGSLAGAERRELRPVDYRHLHLGDFLEAENRIVRPRPGK